MPDTPVSVVVPPVCLMCGHPGQVGLQQNITGNKIGLLWHCRYCDAEWPVRRKEEIPARAS